MHLTITYRNLFLIPALLLLGASSCRMVQPSRAEDLVAVDSLYRDINVSDSAGFANVPWQQLFTDPYLVGLINEALVNNPDMQVAAARISRAAAAFRQNTAELFPSLNAGFNANYQSAGESGFGLPELYQLFGSTSWEADIWGKIRGARRASLANLYASEAFRRAVTTELVASVAINYYSLLALDSQLAITRQTVDRRTRNAEVMEVLKDNDVITGADLVLSQANRYSAEILIPDLERRIYETENLLSLLTGNPPKAVDRGLLEEQELSADFRTGVPAMLLANRPDVVEAEYRLAAFYENIRVARAGFYPSLTINARAGITETALDALFSSPVFFWSIAGGIFQPIFNHGLNRQRLRSAQADYEESQASFRRILLRAGSEVVNAMRGYETASDKIAIRQKQIESLEKAVEYTNELLTYTSTTSYIDVLTSEVNLLSAQLSSVNDKLEQLQAVVELYRSLGGGWREALSVER
jgi:outer membrane protein, multidrug efflux system